MNLWFRLLLLVLTQSFRRRLVPPFDVSRLRFRVWPGDLDTNFHMNNGRYLTLMDLGRFDLMLRGGLAKPALRHRWNPVLSAATVRYRRELRLFQSFHLESRIIHWTDTVFVMEQRVLSRKASERDESVAAHALLKGGLYDRAARRFVPIARLFEAMGMSAESPPATAEVTAFLTAESAMRLR